MSQNSPVWKPSLDWYASAAHQKKCSCGASLAGLSVTRYDHVGGWRVENFKSRQWLYVECPKCHYQSSFTTLGIEGKATFEEQLLEEIRQHGRVTTHTTGFTPQQLEAWLLGKPVPSAPSDANHH